MEERELKTLSLDVKSMKEDGSFTGLLSVYDVIDSHNDVVERGAYTKTLQESGGRVPLLWQHDPKYPIGTLDLKDGQQGLEASGQLLLDDAVPQAKTAYALLKAGVIKGMSIGYKAIRKKQEDSIRRLREVKLFEGSLVTFGACPGAVVQQVKSEPGESKDFLDELQALEIAARHWQMLTALEYSLDRIRYSDGDKASRIAAVQAVIQQFSEAYLAYFPTLMDARGIKSAIEIPSVMPEHMRSMFADLGHKFTQVSTRHPGTAPQSAAASAVELEQKQQIEPEAIHSLLHGFGESLVSAIRA